MTKLVVYGTEVEVLEADEEPEFPEPAPRPTYTHLGRRVDPVNLELALVDCFVHHGWVAVVREGDSDSFFLTDEGERELADAGIALG